MLNGFGITQRNILEGLLQNSGGMTIDEIVRNVDISRTAVNQHINKLEKDGYVKRQALTKTGGRPSQIYILSEEGIHLFPKQYAWFSKLLLENIKEEVGSTGLENILRNLGVSIAGNYSARLAGKTDTDKLMEIAEIMQELGYSGSVDDKEEEVISACNCVYHTLAAEMSEICSFDLALLSSMTGRKVEHIECRVRGGNKCRFKFKEKFATTLSSDYQKLEIVEEQKRA